MTIPRETLDAILDQYCPQYIDGQRERSLTTAIRTTGAAHGYDSASGNPWDYDCADMMLAIFHHYSHRHARDYAEQYCFGAHRGTEARAAHKAAADSDAPVRIAHGPRGLVDWMLNGGTEPRH